MTTLVVYDTTYGNTKTIAEAIAQSFGAGASSVSVSDFNPDMLSGVDVLVIGAPIIAWRPSDGMKKFLSKLSPGQLSGVKAACFDTRIKTKLSGDAAHKMAKVLKKAGADLIIDPEAFIVKGKARASSQREKRKEPGNGQIK
ncbi:MAG: flavodoxin domain-containing protein [Actinomycetota bacterium]|nr:flavodoxin domain-containing protein [Actinomycetota bacterium]